MTIWSETPYQPVRARRRYATDWQDLGDGLSYSPSLKLWYKNGQHYDELSARHNGLIGMGAQLKEMIKCQNSK